MKAFANFKDEIWCMDLAYVDKLAKDNNGIKYLLLSQDVFDRTVHAKGMKAKDSKETVCAFLTMNTKKNRSKKVWVDKGQRLLESLKNFANLKDYNFTPQREIQKLQLLSVQYNPWKIYYTVTWKLVDTNTFTSFPNSSQP